MSFRCFPPEGLSIEERREYMDKKFRKWIKYESSVDWDNFVEPEDPEEKIEF